MDPPSYGRGPNGEVWKLEECISDLVKLTSEVLSDDPLFFLLNSYTTGLSAGTVGYMLNSVLAPKFAGKTEAEEIGLYVTQTGGILPSGSSARFMTNNK
jgi:23S rRNA (cytosine1962-C5)-methyltransferase